MSERGSAPLTRRQILLGAGAGLGALIGGGALGALTGSDKDSLQLHKVRSRYTKPTPSTTTTEAPPTTTTIPEPKPLAPLPPVELPPYVRSGPSDKPRIALTLDDLFGQEGIDNLEKVLQIGRELQVRFTFFPTGAALAEHQTLGREFVWRQAIADGHEIGNHTYSHAPLTRLNTAGIRDELVRTQDELNRVLGFAYPMKLMRPPGGAGGEHAGGNPRVMGVVRELGMSMIMWTCDSNNAGHGQELLTEKFLGSGPEGAQDGSILLTHPHTYAAENFVPLVTRLRNERGLQPTNVSGLFSTGL